ncbi:hypothetical protein GCM10023322_82730 [Rugosimonospora acidiphila]|uniref:BlaI/MecI/CopY family transcriptional regulator n=1 Tax=Rugosimonospora acidiphila TaxID=556531 RepID=A0ABP9SVC4_9ACTN
MGKERRIRLRTDDGAADVAHRRRSGQLEAAVLEALWASPKPLTPTGVQAVLGGGLAYNTVHTVLSRLGDKDLVTRTTVDGHVAYAPTQGVVEWAAAQMESVLRHGSDRNAILHRFVSSLSPDDERALRAALDQETKGS